VTASGRLPAVRPSCDLLEVDVGALTACRGEGSCRRRSIGHQRGDEWQGGFRPEEGSLSSVRTQFSGRSAIDLELRQP